MPPRGWRARVIQQGIDNSENGGVVLVDPAVYCEALNFGFKKIELRSTAGASVTTIDRSAAVSGNITVVTIEGPQGRETVLDGFTITGATRGGGARYLAASRVIRNNIISGNTITNGEGSRATRACLHFVCCRFTVGGKRATQHVERATPWCLLTLPNEHISAQILAYTVWKAIVPSVSGSRE